MLFGFFTPRDFKRESISRPENVLFFPEETLLDVVRNDAGEFWPHVRAVAIAELAVRFFLSRNNRYCSVLENEFGADRLRDFFGVCKCCAQGKANLGELHHPFADISDNPSTERLCFRFRRLLSADGVIPVSCGPDGFLLPFTFSDSAESGKPMVFDADKRPIRIWSEAMRYLPEPIKENICVHAHLGPELKWQPPRGNSLLLPVMAAWWLKNRELHPYDPLRLLFTGSFRADGSVECVEINAKEETIKVNVKDGVLFHPVSVNVLPKESEISEGSSVAATKQAISDYAKKHFSDCDDKAWKIADDRQTERDTLPVGVLYGRDVRERLFVGRKDEVDTVRKALSENGLVIIHGGGGKGKTTLVERVANEWRKSVDGHAFWIDAERIRDWEALFSSLVGLDNRIRDWLAVKPEKQDEDKASDKSTEEKQKQDFKKLLDKCHEASPVLLILDNVEETELFSDQTLRDWFGERFPNHFHVLATSRIGIAKTSTFCPVRQIPLGYLSASDARKLLVAIVRGPDRVVDSLPDDERKALDELVVLTRGHAWTINVIGGFLRESANPDDFSAKPMSFRMALDVYRKRGMSSFSPDDPQQLEKLLVPTLDQIRELPRGEDLFNLSRLAALVARDGVAEKHILRAYLKQTAGVDDSAFENACEILARYSLFDSATKTTVEMHRNTQEVLRGGNNADFLDLTGRFLANYLGLDLRRWPDLMDAGVPGKHCPVRLMDNELLKKVLCRDWSLLNEELIEDFDGSDIRWALKNGPESVLGFPWHWERLEASRGEYPFSTRFPGQLSKSNHPLSPRGFFSPAYWTDVLLDHPSLIHHCNLDNLSHDDLWVLSKAIPSLVDCNSFFRQSSKGIVHYLMAHPEAATEQMLSRLDPEGWQFLVHERKQFERQIPPDVRSLIDWAKQENKKQQFSDIEDDCDYDDFDYFEEPFPTPEEREEERIEYAYETFVPSRDGFLSSENGREIAVYLMLHPEDSSLRSLDAMEPDDWAILFAERPELIEDFGSGKLLGASCEAWVEALSNNPELAEECDNEFELAGGWNMFSGENWVSLLKRCPSLGPHCNPQKLAGPDWAGLLESYPSLAEKCPWSIVSEIEYAPLLVSHPEWMQKFHLSFGGLNEDQWIDLLRNYPEYRMHCHCRFTGKSSFRLARLLSNDPSLLDELHPSSQASLFDPTLLFVREDTDVLPWIWLVTQDKKNATDFFAEWENRNLPIRWEALNSTDLKRLILRHPECEAVLTEKKAWRSIDGADWMTVLRARPSLQVHCDWSKLNADDWADILLVQPDLQANCDWSKLNVDGWEKLLKGKPDGDLTIGRLSVGGQRQFARMMPESLSIADLMRLYLSIPMSSRLMKEAPFANTALARSKEKLKINIQSERTVIPLKPDDFIWPEPNIHTFFNRHLRDELLARLSELLPFCGNMNQFPEQDQLKTLVLGFDRTFAPRDATAMLKLLSEKVFTCPDLSEVDVCLLERRIAERMIHHGFWNDAEAVLDHIPDVVERAKTFASDEMSVDLSLAVHDRFFLCCKGDILWEKGKFQEAINCFTSALLETPIPLTKISSSRISFEKWVSWKRYGTPFFKLRNPFEEEENNHKSKEIIPEFTLRSVSSIEEDISDCKACLSREQSMWRRRWIDKLNWSFNPKPRIHLLPGVDPKY